MLTIEQGSMLTPVMTFNQYPYHIFLLTDEGNCQWLVMMQKGTSIKFLSALGCSHGWALFDLCVQKIRNEGWVN